MFTFLIHSVWTYAKIYPNEVSDIKRWPNYNDKFKLEKKFVDKYFIYVGYIIY